MAGEQERKGRGVFSGAPALDELVGYVAFLLRSRLWLQIVVGMVLGVAVGLALSPSGGAIVEADTAEVIGGWLALPGHLFLALIQMIVVPLVVCSIMLGIASSDDLDYLRRIGMRVIPYFVMTTTVAVTIGATLALLVEPGQYVDQEVVRAAMASANPGVAGPAAPAIGGALPEQLVGLIPTNPLSAVLDQSMLQIVVFAMLVGVALVSLESERAKPLLDLASSVQQLSMEIVGWAMVLAPFAVFGLLSQITMKVGLDAILGMGVYVGTVLLGLALVLLFYLLVLTLVRGKDARGFLGKVKEVQLLAFSTSSSAAVMPLSIRTAEDTLGVRPSVAQFIVPLGATINMDGTALYQVVAAVFLTQVFGVDLSMGALLLLITTTVGASIGSPSTPGVGIVILATILQGIGVPPSGIALIIGVDRILDMSRTALNVTGDLVACAVMDRWLPERPSIDSGDLGRGAMHAQPLR